MQYPPAIGAQVQPPNKSRHEFYTAFHHFTTIPQLVSSLYGDNVHVNREVIPI